MDCTVCHKTFTGRRKPTCASCAQAILYQPRLAQATALLSREKAHTQAEAVVSPGNDGILAALPEDADLDAIEKGVRWHCVERDHNARQAAEARIQNITDKAAQLRKEIESHRAFIAQRKEEQVRRRKDVPVKMEKLKDQHAQATEPLTAAIKKGNSRLKKLHERAIEARTYICQVAYSLSGLRKTKGKDKPQFWLAGLPIPNLHDLNGANGNLQLHGIDPEVVAPHDVVTASLNNLCRFLGLICHYLSIRLPAEILLPQTDFLAPAILPLDDSYKSDTRATRASSSRQPKSEFSRPRPLLLSSPFPILQKEDPKAAAFFREAVVLLAYDIAWLSRTQGLNNTSAFDELADMGQNLYSMLPKRRAPVPGSLTPATEHPNPMDLTSKPSVPRFGHFSHSTASQNLTGHQGAALFGSGSSWDASIVKLVDQLKVHLRRESQRAEWDFIEQTEWDEELEEDRPVFVGGGQKRLDARGAAMSVMTVKPSDDEALPRVSVGEEREPSSGWTKIRGRGGDS